MSFYCKNCGVALQISDAPDLCNRCLPQTPAPQPPIEKQYLVGFTYLNYGQGDYERVPETALVYAENFDDACRKIRQSGRWDNPTRFEDRTVF